MRPPHTRRSPVLVRRSARWRRQIACVPRLGHGGTWRATIAPRPDARATASLAISSQTLTLGSHALEIEPRRLRPSAPLEQQYPAHSDQPEYFDPGFAIPIALDTGQRLVQQLPQGSAEMFESRARESIGHAAAPVARVLRLPNGVVIRPN